MSDAPAPIELARTRPAAARRALRGIRTVARSLHLALAVAIILGVFVQVYLIGAYIFGAGQGLLDAHRSTGFVVQGLEVVVFLAALAALLPRRDLLLSLLLAIVGTVQAGLANAHRWVGGLHPLLALVVLSLAATLAVRNFRRLRDAAPAVRS
jgi:hypothetical protein